MTSDCLFCRIGHREVAAHIVYEDERLLAFLDRGPIRPGHTQIVPRASTTPISMTPRPSSWAPS